MMIKTDFTQSSPLPPRAFLETIMEPTMKAYCFLWDQQNKNHKIKLSWKDICKYYNRNNFRSSLRKLYDKGLLSYKESPLGVHIELTSWQDIMTE